MGAVGGMPNTQTGAAIPDTPAAATDATVKADSITTSQASQPLAQPAQNNSGSPRDIKPMLTAGNVEAFIAPGTAPSGLDPIMPKEQQFRVEERSLTEAGCDRHYCESCK